MSQKVDKTGERTIAVVRKLEKVTSNDVNIGLGYVCVRNRTRNTSYDEARSEKARLFQNHALLSKIDKSMVSIPVPANKLVQIQATILSKCLPDIVRKINDKLAVDVAAVNELPQHMSSVAEALATFMHIMSSATPKEFVLANEQQQIWFLVKEISYVEGNKSINYTNHKGLWTLVIRSPIVSPYSDMIRPLLDCVDKLRQLYRMQQDIKLPAIFKLGHLDVMVEGVQLPTIVLIGAKSSGKLSVLESLAGIRLPRGEGICTRVPLILRLQNHSETEVYLEYNGKSVPTDEVHITDAIILVTNEIAGHGKGISNIPLKLIVKKNGVPDLTMVDLPGTTTVAVPGQTEDVFEQISGIVMEYITPENSIILNVLSATVDFTTCESIRMSRKVDKTGERTLAVVTKVDKDPEGLLGKVSANDMNDGLGYICVKNRTANESYEKALSEERRLFETHVLLSKMDKSMVSIPVLAHKLVQMQGNIISKCFPDIVKEINNKLSVNVAALSELPQHSGTVAEALATFMRTHMLATESLKKIFLKVEFDEYNEDFELQFAAKWSELHDLELNRYCPDPKVHHLTDVLMYLHEAQKNGLPLSEKEIRVSNSPPRAVFLDFLQEKVRDISATTEEFVGKLGNYIVEVVSRVLMHHSCSYPELQYFIRTAVQSSISRRKVESVDWIREIIGMNDMSELTSNPEYVATFSMLMAQKKRFIKFSKYCRGGSNINQAFDLKMTKAAYWKTMFSPQKLGNHEIEVEIVNDEMALYNMRFIAYRQFASGLKKFVNEIVDEIFSDLTESHRGGFENSLQELLIAEKCFRLKERVKFLEEMKEVVAKIMDSLAHHVGSEKA
ncbi:putative dynamin-related protein 4A [Capsicum annuum]|uniref:Dynamin-related protein 4A n=1 Tax=Capsicum annuum TaxID=4072 RepID=A0A2G2YI43_CAPAN|nr:putative dynamin-related protein 4A [Capsicum annuum]